MPLKDIFKDCALPDYYSFQFFHSDYAYRFASGGSDPSTVSL